MTHLPTNKLLKCATIGGGLFLVTLFAQDALKPDFDPIRHPGSSLALGSFGWIQSANFIVAGLLVIAFSIGLRRAFPGSWVGPLLVGYWGLGCVGAGFFLTDPVNGFPPGTPDRPLQSTLHGTIHDLFAVPSFFGLFIAHLLFAWWFNKQKTRAMATYSLFNGIVFVTCFLLAAAAFSQNEALMSYGGLFQRMCVISAWIWLGTLGHWFSKRIAIS